MYSHKNFYKATWVQTVRTKTAVAPSPSIRPAVSKIEQVPVPGYYRDVVVKKEIPQDPIWVEAVTKWEPGKPAVYGTVYDNVPQDPIWVPAVTRWESREVTVSSGYWRPQPGIRVPRTVVTGYEPSYSTRRVCAEYWRGRCMQYRNESYVSGRSPVYGTVYDNVPQPPIWIPPVTRSESREVTVSSGYLQRQPDKKVPRQVVISPATGPKKVVVTPPFFREQQPKVDTITEKVWVPASSYPKTVLTCPDMGAAKGELIGTDCRYITPPRDIIDFVEETRSDTIERSCPVPTQDGTCGDHPSFPENGRIYTFDNHVTVPIPRVRVFNPVQVVSISSLSARCPDGYVLVGDVCVADSPPTTTVLPTTTTTIVPLTTTTTIVPPTTTLPPTTTTTIVPPTTTLPPVTTVPPTTTVPRNIKPS